MKRIVCIILTLIFMLTAFPFASIAKDVDIISGKNAFVKNSDADLIRIAGNEFKSTDLIEFQINIKVSDCSSEYSYIYLNDNKYSKLVDGENIINISTKDLVDDYNEIKIMLGYASATYNESVVYGSVNLDDIKVESVTISGLEETLDLQVNKYMPNEGEAGTTVVSATYNYSDSSGISVGDGWFSDTGLGGNTPYNPVAVGFVFDKPEVNGLFVIDTTKLPDGKYTAEFLKNGSVISQREYIIDNALPSISFSVENGTTVSRIDKIKYSVNDLTSVSTKLYVDGKRASSIDTKKLSVGSHTAFVKAVDEAGNSATAMLLFEVIDKCYSVSFDEESVTMNVYGDASIYSGSLLKDIRMFANPYGDINQNYLRSEDEVLVSFDNKAELLTSSSGNSLPYHSFVINTDGVNEDYVLVSYSGETGNGSDIALKAWNYTKECWDIIGTVASGEAVTVKVELENYSFKDKMRINAVPNLVYNGSDTIIWNSDTQYYSRFEDLNDFYYKICEYTVEQYRAGKIGYYVHTGDLVDQTNAGAEIANNEFRVASNAQKILDDAKVPNGVVSGNHDILHTTADYSYYLKYFSEERYKDFDWYGGSLNDNMHHYDLVSIGKYDFVFLYLGCYKETEEDTIAWANSVCRAYPDRNVVICTHEYLLPSGQYSSERSQVIWDEIIVPNENVMMVLCGHNEGVCDQLKQVGDSDRYVLEILADYQFAELGVGPQHVMNNCTCDGEGYIRLMTFNDAGQLVSTTYSPVAGKYDVDPYNYYPSYSDSFVYDLNLIPADRSIRTTSFNVLHNPEYIGEVGEDDLNLEGYEAFYAEIKRGTGNSYSEVYVLHEYEIDYTADEMPEYTLPDSEKILVTGHKNVSENFRMDEDNEFPTDDFIKVGLNLMPENTNSLYQTSGSKINYKEINDKGGVVLSHEYADNSNWVTLGYNINKKINTDVYNRVYFGVTASPNAKWNIYVNFQKYSLNFSQNREVAKLFGYVNQAPSDIRGTWNGYIDLSQFVQGDHIVSSIYIVSATPGETVTFDYLFLGKSEGGKVSFITDDTTAVAYEAKIGESVAVPSAPFKQGYNFDGWFTSKEGGEKVDSAVKVGDEPIKIYARFSERKVFDRTVKTYNTEINLEQPSVFKIIFVVGSIVVMISVVIVLLVKIKASKNKRGE